MPSSILARLELELWFPSLKTWNPNHVSVRDDIGTDHLTRLAHCHTLRFSGEHPRPACWWVQQEPLVAVEPRRPPRTNVGTETAFTRFRHDSKHIQKSKHLWGQWQLMRSNPCRSTSIYICIGFKAIIRNKMIHYTCLAVSSTQPERNHFRGQNSCRTVFGHTGCWSIAKRSRFSTKFSSSRSFDHHGKPKKNCKK